MIDLEKLDNIYGPKIEKSTFISEMQKFDDSIESLKAATDTTEELNCLVDCCINICGVYHFGKNIGKTLAAGLHQSFGVSPEMKAKVQFAVEKKLNKL